MGVGKRRRRLSIGALGWLLSVSLCGCTGSDEFGAGTGIGSIAALGVGGRTNADEAQPNDSFDAPTPLVLTAARPTSFDGLIQSASDIDVYDAGPLFAGDELTVDVAGDLWLDAAAGVFDADGNVIYINDDRNFFAGQVDPRIKFVSRRDSERCFIAISASPTRRSTGRYTFNVSLTETARRPDPQPQVVLFNFDGATAVAFGGRLPVDIEPFDAATVSPTLAGQTDRLIDLILERVREDYRGLNVAFRVSRGQPLPDGEFSTVHFGAFDPGLLGVAESVDEFNEHTIQEAIVFTDTFEVFNALSPTLEEYAQALANVASHETGHLLGLVHTKDAHGIMDITASLRQLTRNQAFSRSPIEGSTFTLGSQDAAVTLVDAVGGDLETVRRNGASQLTQARIAASDERADLPDGPRVAFSTCTRRACVRSRSAIKPPVR